MTPGVGALAPVRGARVRRTGKDVGRTRWALSGTGKTLLEPKLKASEQVVYDSLQREGWRVYRNGWPDFLAERDGEIRLIEVKKDSAPLRPEQKRVRKVLGRAGLQVEVVRVRTQEEGLG